MGFTKILAYRVEGKIQEQLQQISDSVNVEKIDVHLLAGNISLENIVIYDHLINDSTVSKTPLNGRISRLDVLGLSWWNLIKNDRIEIRNLRCAGLNVIVDRSIEVSKEDTDQNPGKGIPVISIGKVGLENARIAVMSNHHRGHALTIDSLSSTWSDLQYSDSASFNFESWHFSLADARYIGSDSLHTLSIDSIGGETRTGEIRLTGLALSPNYSRTNFVKNLDYRTSMVSLRLPRLTFYEVDYKELFRDSLRCGLVEIHDLSLDLFEDHHLPAETDIVKKLPHHALAGMDQFMHIDSVIVHTSHVTAEFLLPGEQESVVISFNDVEGLLSDIHNYPNSSENNISVMLKSKFQNQSEFILDANFPVSTSRYVPFTFTGHLADFPISEINGVLEKSANIHFDKGFVDDLYFNVTADDRLAKGDLRMFYRNMDLELDRRSNESFILKPLDEIVEQLTAPNENLPGKKHIVGTIYFSRNHEKSLFHYMWNAVFTGIKSTFLPNLLLPGELHHRKVSVD